MTGLMMHYSICAGRCRLLLRSIAFTLLSCVSLGASADTGNIAVLFPDIGDPYRAIFSKIIDGIQLSARGRVQSYPISNATDTGELNQSLKRQDAHVIIALGKQGVKAATTIDPALPVVIGAVVSQPNIDRTSTGISLIPDPALLFDHLKAMLPNVRRVYVIYDPQQNDWLIKRAREAARARGLELVSKEAHDLGEAARLYQSLFDNTLTHADALWLPQDSVTVDENTIVPLVLQESWDHGIGVFSSSFLHVKKGVLFALYPNNLELGRDLGNTAMAILAGAPTEHGLALLRDVNTAINVRTASHIGLDLSTEQLRGFDVVFPEP